MNATRNKMPEVLRVDYWKRKMQAKIQVIKDDTLICFRDLAHHLEHLGESPECIKEQVDAIGKAYDEIEAIVRASGVKKMDADKEPTHETTP